MAKRVASSELPSPAASSEMSANQRLAEGIKALKERHKEAKADLKRRHAQELAEEQAEAKRQEDRRNYLIGRSVRSDRSEAGLAFELAHAERMTHPSDRKLFGLAPLPESGKGDAGAPAEKIEKWDERGGDGVIEDAPYPTTTDGFPGPLEAEEREERSEQDPLLANLTVVSESHPGRRERGEDAAAGERPNDVPHGSGTHAADALTPYPEARDDVASAGRGVEDRQADPDRNGKEGASSSSTTPPEDVDSWDGGTKVQALDMTAMKQASVADTVARTSFAPQVFLSTQGLKEQIDQTGAKRTRSADGRWVATATTPEQAASLVALKLQPYEPK